MVIGRGAQETYWDVCGYTKPNGGLTNQYGGKTKLFRIIYDHLCRYNMKITSRYRVNIV